MQVVTRQDGGLFPSPKEIELDCSCPDWADLCKHVAASLYGVGARLDTNPELLFVLRGVDPADLISKASAAEAVKQTTKETPAMSDSEVADVFGIELDSAAGAASQSSDLTPARANPEEPGPPGAAAVQPTSPSRGSKGHPKLSRKMDAATPTPQFVSPKKGRKDRANRNSPVRRRVTRSKAPPVRAVEGI
jgi:hypothetical protein